MLATLSPQCSASAPNTRPGPFSVAAVCRFAGPTVTVIAHADSA